MRVKQVAIVRLRWHDVISHVRTNRQLSRAASEITVRTRRIFTHQLEISTSISAGIRPYCRRDSKGYINLLTVLREGNYARLPGAKHRGYAGYDLI